MSDQANTSGLPQPGETWTFFDYLDHNLALSGLLAKPLTPVQWEVMERIRRADENGKQSRPTS